MSLLSGRRILVGVTGGIAAYKTVYLCRLLQEEGCEVRVAMTASATKFVTPLTFETITQHPVAHTLFPAGEFVATRHIAWAQWADLCIVAPATYNFVGKLAHGVADDALSTLVAALPADRPLFLALAMNSEMYAQPVLQENVRLLQERGVHIIDAETGFLAERMEGKGRMAEPESIVAFVSQALREQAPWAGRRVLVTAGPTREAIDPVRYITNASSGKMGYAVAAAAVAGGADVTLVTGPVSLEPPRGARVVKVTTAREMHQAVTEAWPEADALFMVAAVADFVPRDPASHKLKKAEPLTSLALEPAPDILAQCGKVKRPGQLLVGFALETRNDEAEARRKLAEKNLDLVVINNPSTAGAGFEVDTNVVTLLTADASQGLPLLPKTEVAKEIVARALELLSRVGMRTPHE
jgi:phosphopantothenoylcysteine decarboxylase / phosphopantothenate---cysteine ligase